MSIFAWYDIPTALLVGGIAYLAYQDWQRTMHRFFRHMDLYLMRSERRVEDFYWGSRDLRVSEAATAELFFVNRTIESYVNGTAEIERPRELHSVNVSHLEEVV